MLVSSVCANKFWAVDNCNIAVQNEPCPTNTDNAAYSFTSSLKKNDADMYMDCIYEWKTFCQEEMSANTFDCIV